MISKILDYLFSIDGGMINKILDYVFPIGGGITGALLNIREVSFFPDLQQLVNIVILSALGALTGLIVKKIWDLLFKKKTQ